MIQQLLGTLHRNGTLARDELGPLRSRRDGRVLGVVHLADEAHGERLVGREVARREADVFHPRRGPDELGQPAEGAEVGGETDVDLFDGEASVARGDAHVGAA